MAYGKKSFVLYSDFIDVFNELSDQDAGQLIKHIFQYVNDKNPVTENPIVKISFIPIKNQLKRDLIEWEEKRTERSEAGKKGMASRWHNKDKKAITNDNTVIKPITKITVTDNVTVNVTDTVNVKEWDFVKINFFNSYEWKEKFCRDKSLTMPELEKKMNEFISDTELREDYKELKELKSHFTNTFNKNKNGKPGLSGVGKTIDFDLP